MNKKDKWQAIYDHYQATKKMPIAPPPAVPAALNVPEQKYVNCVLNSAINASPWGHLQADLPLELQPAPKKKMLPPPRPIPGKRYRVINHENTWVEKKVYMLFKIWIPSMGFWEEHKPAILSGIGFNELNGDVFCLMLTLNNVWDYEKEECYA